LHETLQKIPKRNTKFLIETGAPITATVGDLCLFAADVTTQEKFKLLITYYSKPLSATKKKHMTIEKVLMSIVYKIEYNKHILVNSVENVEVCTNHRNSINYMKFLIT
jgi:RNase H-like domain found in reverse transcriptase